MTAAQLAKRWRTKVWRSHAVQISPADPCVLNLCRAALAGEPLEEVIRELVAIASEYYDWALTDMIGISFVAVCEEAGVQLPALGPLRALVSQFHRHSRAVSLMSRQIRDSWTGLDSPGSFLSQLWVMSHRTGRSPDLIVVRAAPDVNVSRERIAEVWATTGPFGADRTTTEGLAVMMGLGHVMRRCVDRYPATVLADGLTGLVCVPDSAAHLAVLQHLQTIAPHLPVISYPVPRVGLDEFSWWLVRTIGLDNDL